MGSRLHATAGLSMASAVWLIASSRGAHLPTLVYPDCASSSTNTSPRNYKPGAGFDLLQAGDFSDRL